MKKKRPIKQNKNFLIILLSSLLILGISHVFLLSQMDTNKTKIGYKHYNGVFNYEINLPYKDTETKTAVSSLSYNNQTYLVQSNIPVKPQDVPEIKIVSSWRNPKINPYDPKIKPTKIVINNIEWNVFYNAVGGSNGCDTTTFITPAKGSTSSIVLVTYEDKKVCPGDKNDSKSTEIVKEFLSTFKFTN